MFSLIFWFKFVAGKQNGRNVVKNWVDALIRGGHKFTIYGMHIHLGWQHDAIL